MSATYDMQRIMEERRARHEAQSLERCKTPAQRERVQAMYAADADVDVQVYPEKVGGGSIVRACRAYLTTGDAEKITAGLYDFATTLLGEIAHFDIGGFRHVYRDAADFVRLIETDATRYGHNAYSQHVYTDGMTGDEVRAGLLGLALELGPMVRDRSKGRARAEALALALALAAEHGFEVSA